MDGRGKLGGIAPPVGAWLGRGGRKLDGVDGSGWMLPRGVSARGTLGRGALCAGAEALR